MRIITWKRDGTGASYNAKNMPPGTYAMIYPDGGNYVLEVDIHLNKFYFRQYTTEKSAMTYGGKKVVKLLNEYAKNNMERW